MSLGHLQQVSVRALRRRRGPAKSHCLTNCWLPILCSVETLGQAARRVRLRVATCSTISLQLASAVAVINAKRGAKSRHDLFGFFPIVRDGGNSSAKGAKRVALTFWPRI